MPWPLQIFFSSKNSISDVLFPSIIFRTIYDDMQDKEFESINAMTRENDKLQLFEVMKFSSSDLLSIIKKKKGKRVYKLYDIRVIMKLIPVIRIR